MRIATFFAILTCFCLPITARCASKKPIKSKTTKASQKKAKKNVSSGRLLPNGAPPPGLYEVRVYFSGNSAENHDKEYDVYSDFKWLRLYKNGNYKTNLTRKGKVEGHYTFKSQTQEIIWKVFHPDKNSKLSKDMIKISHPDVDSGQSWPTDYTIGCITDGYSANCYNGWRGKCVLIGFVQYFESFGSVYFYWKRP